MCPRQVVIVTLANQIFADLCVVCTRYRIHPSCNLCITPKQFKRLPEPFGFWVCILVKGERDNVSDLNFGSSSDHTATTVILHALFKVLVNEPFVTPLKPNNLQSAWRSGPV